MTNTDKRESVTLLKKMKSDLRTLKKKCEDAPGKQIQAKALLREFEEVATEWFEEVEPLLRSSYRFANDAVASYREGFGKILEVSASKPSKRIVLGILSGLIESFHEDLLVPVQMHYEVSDKFPSLDDLLLHVSGPEIEYMGEAIDCAKLGKFRASIILGWCAAVNRFHHFIRDIGFVKFNAATVQMSAIQTGRYKRFRKQFNIQNLADLRMTVFDNDLLWVLEFLGAIDGNQHERLEICLTMRNTSAHPGDASISHENVLSFFSDLNAIVFDNEKFVLSEKRDFS